MHWQYSESVFLDKFGYQSEDLLVGAIDEARHVVLSGVIEGESAAFFVLEEDARHAFHGERIMVAVGCQLASVERIEIVAFGIQFLE